MSNYNQNGINFNNVKDGGKVQSSSPIWTGQVGVDEFGGIINVVDIDWNGAEVTGAKSTNLAQDNPTTINTTGELLAWIQQMISKERFFVVLQQYIDSNSLNIQVQGGKLYIDTTGSSETPVITLTPSSAQVITAATTVSSFLFSYR